MRVRTVQLGTGRLAARADVCAHKAGTARKARPGQRPVGYPGALLSHYTPMRARAGDARVRSFVTARCAEAERFHGGRWNFPVRSKVAQASSVDERGTPERGKASQATPAAPWRRDAAKRRRVPPANLNAPPSLSRDSRNEVPKSSSPHWAGKVSPEDPPSGDSAPLEPASASDFS